MIRTQAQLTEEQATTLKELARERGSSVAELIREGVDLLLATRHEPSREDRKRRALAVVGRFSSKASDVSRRHDEYFVEAAADWAGKRRAE